MIYVAHDIPRADAALGVVRAEDLAAGRAAPGLEDRLAALVEARTAPLTEREDAVRKAVRDLLRNGRYKPTGRGKPASEYLVRAVQEEAYRFPRINAPVDVANYISLSALLPVSLWDLDRAGTTRFRFRLGRPGEAYAFNTAGQTIRLDDLIVGCRLDAPDDDGTPIVNPVKDSLATKTTDQTRRVAACIYAPLPAVPADALEDLCETFAALLAGCGDDVEAAYGVVRPGERRRV